MSFHNINMGYLNMKKTDYRIKIENLYAEKTKFKKDIDITILSETQINVLKLLTLGYSNLEIAKILYISYHTVKSYASFIMEMFGAKNRTELTFYAMQNNIFEK